MRAECFWKTFMLLGSLLTALAAPLKAQVPTQNLHPRTTTATGSNSQLRAGLKWRRDRSSGASRSAS